MSDNPFAQYGITDPDAIAYLKRYPDVAAVVPQYGANTAQLHYDKWGRNAGWKWGQDEPAPVVQEAPVDPGPSIYGNGADNWAAYRSQAQAGTEGINRMPFVFSGFPTIPTDPKAAMALFYQNKPAMAQAQGAQNPLLSLQSLQTDIDALKQANEAKRPQMTFGTK